VLLLAGLLIGTTAKASAWYMLWSGNNERRFFFDAESIERNGGQITVWIKTVKTDLTGASAVRWRASCAKKTLQMLTWSDYDGQGKFIKSGSGTDEQDVIPDTMGDVLLKIVCEPNFPKDTSGKSYMRAFDNDVFLTTKRYMEIERANTDTAPK
jgi:hypothetical protein